MEAEGMVGEGCAGVVRVSHQQTSTVYMTRWLFGWALGAGAGRR